MFTLAAADTIAAGASAASLVTCTIFGMELNAGTEAYKVIDQRQLAASPATIYTVGANTTAFIRTIMIVNNDTNLQTFQLFRGGTAASNAITPVFALAPKYSMVYEDGIGWRTFDDSGQMQTAFGPYITLQNWGITGSKAETMDRNQVTETNTALLVSGRLSMQAIWLQAGLIVTSISFFSATTALATGTNQLFGLYDINRNLLRSTTNDTSTAWAANTIKTLPLTSTYQIQYTGLYYLGIMVAATTVPTIKGITATTGAQLHGAAPILSGTSTTGLTSSLPNPAAAITVATTSAWGCVS